MKKSYFIFAVACILLMGGGSSLLVSCKHDSFPSIPEIGSYPKPPSRGEWADDYDENYPEEEDLPPVAPDSATGLVEFTSLTADDFTKKKYEEITTANNAIINCSSDEIVEVDAGKATVSGVKYTNRIKLGGTGSLEKRNIKIYVGKERKGTLTVHCASSNSKGTGRNLMANDVKLGEAPTSAGTLMEQVIGDKNGYIIIYSASQGINIYGIVWSTGSGIGDGSGVVKVNPSEPTLPVLDNSEVAPTYTYGRRVGMRSTIKDVNTDGISNALFVSPGGKSTNEGTKASPMDLQTAISKVQAGGAIVLKAGTYKFSKTIKVAYGNNGTSSAKKYILPEKGGAAVFDFSTQPISDSNRGFQLDGDYWHIYGITCYNAGDNGMYVTGKHNIIERCVFQANQDTGLQIARRAKDLSDKADWPSDNLILNCTAFDNKDDSTGENADGFAAKLTCGDGNIFDGCISYANCDDGWDLYAKEATGPIGVVTIRNCVAFQNGKTTTGENYASGDMNGFKLGGSNGAVRTPHIVTNCASFNNGKDGFTDNGNGGALQVSNCSSYGNVSSNFNFYRTIDGGVFTNLVSMGTTATDKFGTKTDKAYLENSVYANSKKFYYQKDKVEVTNGQKIGDIVSDPFSTDLVSTDDPDIGLDVDAKCRNTDGTINISGFLEMKSSSVYKDLGAHFGDEAETVFPCGL